MAKRNRPSVHIPVLAYDSDNYVFQCRGGYLGVCWESAPMVGADDQTADMLANASSLQLPAGSFLQFSMIGLPHIKQYTTSYLKVKAEGMHRVESSETQRTLLEVSSRRAAFIEAGAKEPLLPSSGQLMHDRRLIISLKIPIAGLNPTEKEAKFLCDVKLKYEDSLRAAGIFGRPMRGKDYVDLIASLYKSGEGAQNIEVVDNLTLDEQCFQPGDRLDTELDRLVLNEATDIRVLGVKALPKSASLALGYMMLGDYLGNNNQLRCPYLLSLSIHFPDQAKKKSDMKTKSVIASYQAFGPLLKFIPRLAAKKNSMDIVMDCIERGEPVIEASLGVALIHSDSELLSGATAALATYYDSLNITMQEEKGIVLPAFTNLLPLAPTAESVKNLFRYSTMGVSHALALAPLMGEWKGTERDKAAMLYATRRGQVGTLDFYSGSANYNAVVFAGSGAGKSFWAQQVVSDYLAAGAKVWTIDVGRSYYKQCKAYKGEFIDFRADSGICLNPFTNVVKIDDEVTLIGALIEKMAAPVKGFEDFQRSSVEQGIKAVWGSHGNASTIDDVATYFLEQDDPRISDIGAQLFSFTKQGSMGSWFNGRANVDLSKDFVVLELEELKSNKVLQQVVLMQVISAIQHEMYLAGKSRPLILLLDEAWDLLKDPIVARFLEDAWRRFRKYEGCGILITQDIADLYESASGRAIATNSDFKIVMKQNPESIARIQDSKQLVLGANVFQQMGSVHTVLGKYSEFMVICSSGIGIFRLITDRFSQVLFSTKGRERSQVMADIDNGKPAVDAVNDYIAEYG
ncbi:MULTISPECIES: type IV secretion system protein TraC [Acidovorax]|uniref:Type IV secretion system protein TraC n=1 Tax=Acidovorax facilis TaxID=12917 RepID=A0ABV8DJ05_9BURK|nr:MULTISPECIES: type IV secretion system protein TraC [Acidovorax]KQB57328.1 hypothetical protein AE621_21380 [Acidovorax sp. SD340]MBO1008176.1 type IV secretion system protein TraC [Acidovorax sp. SD340]MCO4241694.1 type IV secretion system protein TraC [Acidovorax facilis]